MGCLEFYGRSVTLPTQEALGRSRSFCGVVMMGLVHGLLLRITHCIVNNRAPLPRRGTSSSGPRMGGVRKEGGAVESVMLGGMKRDSVSSCLQEPAQFSSLGVSHVTFSAIGPHKALPTATGVQRDGVKGSS
jgi:hypothetical protein